ncbi:MAG: 30S ribosomal protein S12 methylthiotransferase RimO [Candidatus Aminicenantes bacterium]|nr:30S ribosomal protein S12 methylthiotransferase RimO [Candidatus Aminicenantes bacterium]
MSEHGKKSIALVSLGCAKNLVDSEVMLGVLGRAGHRAGAAPEDADVLIINTCGFIRPARDESEKEIRRALGLKRRNPRLKVVVAGCYVERSPAELAGRFAGVDAWLGVRSFDRIDRVVEGRAVRPGPRTFLCSHNSPRLLSTPSGWAYVKISEGCSHRCTFCAIPGIKGPYRSRLPSSIVREARRLSDSGVREINLISQDSSFYGRDLGLKHGLAGLLDALSALPGPEWIRVLYLYPGEVGRELLEAMKAPKVCAYFDLPFQHASPNIVKAMGRGLDGERALRLLDRIRDAIPEAAIRTSLIVGFPGERRREFEILKSFVLRARFDHLGVFTYSPEKGTPAFSLGDTVSEAEKISRRGEIMALQQAISLEKNRRRVGRRMETLLESAAANATRTLIGRGRFQAPEADGIIRVAAPPDATRVLHRVRQVEITHAGVYDLRGRLRE